MLGVTCLNVRTLGDHNFDFDYAIDIFAEYMRTNKIEILFLSETHCKDEMDTTYYTAYGSYRVITSGITESHRQGVAFIVSKNISERITTVSRCRDEPGRLLALTVRLTSAVTKRIVGVYAPSVGN